MQHAGVLMPVIPCLVLGTADLAEGGTNPAPPPWRVSAANPPAIVVVGPPSEPMAFAAAELRRYLESILGATLPREAGQEGRRPVIRLAVRPDVGWADEAFELAASGNTFSIRGGGDLGLVFGTYEFLRRFGGCRFSDLGADGEHVPRKARIEAEPGPLRMQPRLWYRALQFPWLEDAELSRQRIDWMAKNGLNYLMYSPAWEGDDKKGTAGQLREEGKSANLRPAVYGKSWFDRELRPEVRRRGLKLDMNHHNLLYWLPPQRYRAAHPDWYALIDGTRAGSLSQLCICTSNREAVGTLIDNVRAYLRENPEVKIVGVIQEDGYGACLCDGCVAGDWDPNDAAGPVCDPSGAYRENRAKTNRYATLLNAVARAIRDEFPDVLVGGAAYVDMVFPPRDVVLEPNIVIWVALYWRDGCRPLAAADTSERNLRFFDIPQQWRSVFAGRLTVYEYYMGMSCQRSLPYPMSEIICRDWPALEALGVQGATVQCRSTCHSAYLLNFLAFARCGWHDRVDHRQVLADYLLGAYGSVADHVRPIFEALLQATRDWALARGPLLPDADNVRHFASPAARIVFRDALRSATQKAPNERERRQVARLAAAVRYWEMAADFFELNAQSVPLAKSDPRTALNLLDRALDESWPPLREYMETSVPPGWLDRDFSRQWNVTLKAMRNRADELRRRVAPAPAANVPAAPGQRELIRDITEAGVEYSIEMGGTLDDLNTARYQPMSETNPNLIELPGFQPNVAVTLANIGTHDVVNPRLVVNDRHDWFSLNTLVAEVAKPGMAERDKAMAIFEVFRDNFHHTNAPRLWVEHGLLDSHSYDPIKHLNWFENTGCSCMAIAMASVWESAGLKSRVINFGVDHWVSEVFYDDAWHLFDADMKVFHLRRDNTTVAGLDDCRADPGLTQRSHPYGFASPYASGCGSYGANSASPHAAPKDHTMALTLRPGESLTRWWQDPDAKPAARDGRYAQWEPKYGRGKLLYKPDLSKPNALDGAAWHHNVALFAADGHRPYLHTKQAPYYCELVFPVRSPYPIVGGRIQVTFDGRDGGGFYPQVFVSFEGRNWLTLWSGPSNQPSQCDVSLDSFIDTARRTTQCQYFVKLTWLPWHGQALMGIDSLCIETDLALSLRSLPTLRLGRNKVVYRDDTDAARNVRVTHVWRESSANTPPAAPAAPVAPLDAASADSNAPRLRWEPATDANGDAVVDHHVEVRARPDMRFPVATSLDRLTFSGEPEWRVPGGWLIPGERYYWRVRARDGRGAWSTWSPVWSFVAGHE